MTSRFFAGGGSDSESSSDEEEYSLASEEEQSEDSSEEESEEEEDEDDSDSDSDSDDEGGVGAARFLKAGGGGASNFLKGGDSSDESEDERQQIKSARDKRFDELHATDKQLQNALKINDWSQVSEHFDKAGRLIPNLSKALSGKTPPLYSMWESMIRRL